MKIVIIKRFALCSLHLHFQIPITKMDTGKIETNIKLSAVSCTTSVTNDFVKSIISQALEDLLSVQE